MKGSVYSMIIIGLHEHELQKLFTAKLNFDAAEAVLPLLRFALFLDTAWHIWKRIIIYTITIVFNSFISSKSSISPHPRKVITVAPCSRLLYTKLSHKTFVVP